MPLGLWSLAPVGSRGSRPGHEQSERPLPALLTTAVRAGNPSPHGFCCATRFPWSWLWQRDRGSAGDGDPQDLAEPGGGPAEAEVGHVQRSVWAEGDRGRERQPGGDHGLGAGGADLDDPPGAELARAGETWCGHRFERVDLLVCSEREAEHRGQAPRPGFDLAAGGDLEQRLASRRDRERAEVPEEEVPLVRQRGRDDVTLTGRDVDQAADRAAGRVDTVDLAVVGLDGIQIAPDRGHAVPGPVRLEVSWFRVRDWVGLLEPAQIGDRGG